MGLRVFKAKDDLITDSNSSSNSEKTDELNYLSLEQIILMHKEEQQQTPNSGGEENGGSAQTTQVKNMVQKFEVN